MTTEEMQSFLVGLEAKRDALNQAIESLRVVLGLEAGGSTPGVLGLPREITSTTFWGKTIPDATKLYLQMVNKKPQSTVQIADALLKGGMETNAKDFPATVQAMLRRFENQADDVIRVPSGEWALAEWFPDRPRRRKVKGKAEGGAEAEAEEATANGTPVKAAASKAAASKGTPTEPAPPSSPTAPSQP